MSQMENAARVAGESIPPLDVAAVREDFPILHQSVHGKPLVYLDSAASAQKPRAVIDAVSRYYERDHANVHRGVHTLSQRATDAYEGARETVRRFLDASSTREIVFVRGTTEAVNLVASSYGRPALAEGDEVLVTAMEHHSNIVPWQMLCRETGATLKVVPIDDRGALVVDTLEQLIGACTRIVAVGHVSNALGTINPVADIVRRAHDVGAVVLVDGAQAVPHMRANVRELDCDFYAFSAHKMYGPTGIGVLYGKEALLDAMPPYQGGGEMIKKVTFEDTVFNDLPHKFEAGTPSIAQAVGLGAAIDYLDGLDFDAVGAHESDLLEYATGLASGVPGLRLVGTAARKSSILSFVLDGVHPHDVGTILDHEGVAVRTGHHCAMPVMQHFGIAATARASLGIYNTREDVDALFAGIAKVQEVFGR